MSGEGEGGRRARRRMRARGSVDQEAARNPLHRDHRGDGRRARPPLQRKERRTHRCGGLHGTPRPKVGAKTLQRCVRASRILLCVRASERAANLLHARADAREPPDGRRRARGVWVYGGTGGGGGLRGVAGGCGGRLRRRGGYRTATAEEAANDALDHDGAAATLHWPSVRSSSRWRCLPGGRCLPGVRLSARLAMGAWHGLERRTNWHRPGIWTEARLNQFKRWW